MEKNLPANAGYVCSILGCKIVKELVLVWEEKLFIYPLAKTESVEIVPHSRMNKQENSKIKKMLNKIYIRTMRNIILKI